MSFTLYLSGLLGSISGSSVLVSIAIILATFVLEDPTTVLVGVLAADGQIGIPLALFSLYAGIVLGDLGLYGLGYLARSHPRLARYVDHDLVAPFRLWLESRYILTVFSVRFIPGLRLPTYTASGFFRMPLGTFAITAIGATAIWTTMLFYASYWFGNLTSAWVGPVRWGIALLFLIALFFFGRRNLRTYRAGKKADA